MERVEGARKDRLKDHFSWNATRQCYLAAGLTADVVENAQKAAAYKGPAVYVSSGAAGATVTTNAMAASQAVIPSRPYAAG